MRGFNGLKGSESFQGSGGCRNLRASGLPAAASGPLAWTLSCGRFKSVLQELAGLQEGFLRGLEGDVSAFRSFRLR